MNLFKEAKYANRSYILITAIIFSILANGAHAMGEKNKTELNNLWSEIKKMLIRSGHCNSAEDCFKRIPIYGEGGDRININIYGPASKESVMSILDFVMQEGLIITNGVPVTVQVFQKEKKEYINRVIGNFAKPKIKLEVNE